MGKAWQESKANKIGIQIFVNYNLCERRHWLDMAAKKVYTISGNVGRMTVWGF